MQEQDLSQPTKRIKLDLTPQTPPQIFCNCFSEQQSSELLSAITALKSYTKYVSITIRHQQKSLQVIPKEIKSLPQFAQLGERINKCIEKAKYNNDFLEKIVRNYSPYLQTLQSAKNVSQQGLGGNSIFNLFVQVLREWSSFSEHNIKPINTIVQLIRQFIQDQSIKQQTIQNGNKKRARVFIQGAGMGRIVAQIWEKFGDKIQSMQGCQDRVLQYLCAEYFLSTYKNKQKRSKIYPFIHDFTNKYHTLDPYKQLQVPHLNINTKTLNPPAFSLTLTAFEPFYQSNTYNNQWDILISYLCNERVLNILKWIQIVYKGLVENGLWIIACYSSWERNVIPMTYAEVREVLSKSMFKIIKQTCSQEYLMSDAGMTREMIQVHYLVLRK